jgi:carboxymethylenebutenolidase
VFEEDDAELMLSEIVRVTRPGGRVGIAVRAIDMPFWVNLSLEPVLKAKVDAPGIIGGGAAPKGVADMSLSRRLAALGLTGLRCLPQLVSVVPGSERIERYQQQILAALTPAKVEMWRQAVTAAEVAGTFFIAQAYHCAVATKPGSKASPGNRLESASRWRRTRKPALADLRPVQRQGSGWRRRSGTIGCDRQAARAVARSPRSTDRSEEQGTVMNEPSAEWTRLAQLWEEHMRHEFQTCSTEDTLATMVEDAYVNHVPVMTGGVGHAELRQFYATHFIPKMPPDMEMTPLSRTIGTDQLVDEMVVRFTHTVEMDWMLPGVAPTGKRVEVALVVIVHFRDGKLAHEHIYWDQASVLAQLGLIDASTLPVCGVDTARKALDPSLPANALIRRAALI